MKEHINSASPNFIRAIGAGQRFSRDINTDATFASGTIVYSVNLAVGDTINANGTTFTAVASGAAGNQFNIAASLTLTLDNIVTVLNASVITAVALATYSKVSTTTLKAINDIAGEIGNSFILTGYSSAAPAVVNYSRLSGGAVAETIGFLSETYSMIVNGGSNSAVVLPAGEDGQEVTLFLKTKGGAGNVVVTPSSIPGGTTLTFSLVGKLARLKYMGGTWNVIVNTATLA